MQDRKLSEHFLLSEFLASDVAKANKILNEPTSAHLRALEHTAQYLCEPMRKLFNAKYGKCSIIITSGYRSKALNDKLKGASNSQHLKGEAIDFKVKKGSKYLPYTQVYEDIKAWVKEGKLSVDQCICECICEKSGNTVWVHCSHSSWGKTRDRRQFLKYNNGKYTLDVDFK